MIKINPIQKSIMDAIEMMIEERAGKLSLDYTITGKILSYDSTSNTYSILYNGSTIYAKAREGLSLQPDDVVYIRVIQGNFSEKFIDCKKP